MALVAGILVWVVATAARGPVGLRTRLAGRAAVGALWLVTAGIVVRRFIGGLGAVSGMSDRFPWGIWIGLDVMSGVALAAGGYVVAATVHLFRIRRFTPILRPTVLTAFLGYQLVAVALLLDIGRPYRIWHPLVMWQHHSIMFEVAWCVTLYSSVLALEFSPVVFERLGLDAAARAVHLVTIPLVILGVILSTMHQSSLGSLFLIMPGKLSPLWYSPLLPVFFLLSSVAVGLAMTVVESSFSGHGAGGRLAEPLLQELARAMGVVLTLYVLLRLADLTVRGAWGGLGAHPVLGAVLLAELLAGAALPAWLLARESVRRDARRLLGTALLVVGGVVLNRVGVSWLGFIPYSGQVYIPSWMEVAVTLTFMTGGIAIFAAAVRWLPVYPAAVASVT